MRALVLEIGTFITLALIRAVGNGAQNIITAHRLQAEEIHRRAVGFTHQRHQHIQGKHLALVGLLHMHNGALQHALKAYGGLGFGVGQQMIGQQGRVFHHAADKLLRQNIALHPALLQQCAHVIALLEQHQQ